MSSELTSELYESLISVQPWRPCFTSIRMATGSRRAIPPASSPADKPNFKATTAQVIELATEASSINGMVYFSSHPCLYTYVTVVDVSPFDTSAINTGAFLSVIE